MNFLAHLRLAEPEPLAWIGSLLPDLAQGSQRRVQPDAPRALREAAAQHRRVDALTDTHPQFARTRAMLRPAVGRFAAVVTDIVYDHSLASRWPMWHDEPLAVFSQRVYQGMVDQQSHIPPTMRPAIDHMRHEDWLSRYQTLDGLEATLLGFGERLGRRFNRPVTLTPAVQVVQHHIRPLHQQFGQLFEDLLQAGTGAPVAA
jgi:acyl carrier protein phosphodiesterase